MKPRFLRALAACALATWMAGSAWAQSCSPSQRLQVGGAEVCVNEIQLGRMTPTGQSASLASVLTGQSSVAGVVGPASCPAIVSIESSGNFIQRNVKAQNACMEALRAKGAAADCQCALLVQDGSVKASQAAFERYSRPAPVMVAAAPAALVRSVPAPAATAPAPAVHAAPVRQAPVTVAMAAPAPSKPPEPSAAEVAKINEWMQKAEQARIAAEKEREAARLERERAQQAIEEARKAAAEQIALAAARPQADSRPAQLPQYRKMTAHALVIGNAAYQYFGALANTTNDAKAIAKLLESMGIGVDLVLDADRSKLSMALRNYRERARGKDLNLVFYAGHGVQVDGLNYLIPVDMKSDKLAVNDVAIDAVRVDDVINGLPARTRIIFLDACRDNPLANTRVSSRSVGGTGLAPINASSGTLIAYATKDGQTADDGNGVNSPFTTALLQHLPAPQDISIVLRQVRETVLKMTNNRQEPWEYGSLLGEALVLSQIAR